VLWAFPAPQDFLQILSGLRVMRNLSSSTLSRQVVGGGGVKLPGSSAFQGRQGFWIH